MNLDFVENEKISFWSEIKNIFLKFKKCSFLNYRICSGHNLWRSSLELNPCNISLMIFFAYHVLACFCSLSKYSGVVRTRTSPSFTFASKHLHVLAISTAFLVFLGCWETMVSNITCFRCILFQKGSYKNN